MPWISQLDTVGFRGIFRLLFGCAFIKILKFNFKLFSGDFGLSKTHRAARRWIKECFLFTVPRFDEWETYIDIFMSFYLSNFEVCVSLVQCMYTAHRSNSARRNGWNAKPSFYRGT